MDYKINFIYRSFFALYIFVLVQGCNGKSGKESSIRTVYYLEILNGDDSLKNSLEDRVVGKVSFYKNDRPTLVSKNFMTEEFPESHAYESVKSLPQKIEKGTKKITVEFTGNFLVDSTFYAVRLFSYGHDKWNKISDMGFIKAEPRYSTPPKDKLPVKDLLNTLTLAIVEATYRR